MRPTEDPAGRADRSIDTPARSGNVQVAERSATTALLVAILLTTVSLAVVVRSGHRTPQSHQQQALPSARQAVLWRSTHSTVELVDFLPQGFVSDGSVDYTEAVQRAIDAAAGRSLVLPPFPLLVSAKPGTLWCVRISKPLELRGSPGSVLRETRGGVIVLYAEQVNGLRFEGFKLEGSGRDGVDLGHGLLQVAFCEDVLVQDVGVTGGDADGIAIAASKDVRILSCNVRDCSKAAIYVSACTNVLVQGNVTRDSGGHLVSGSGSVGSAIQLSSNQNLVCSGNVLLGGIGIGILCNALPNGPKPDGCVLTANRVLGFRNPTNVQVSGGIRCDNVGSERDTHTLVTSNSMRDCGVHAIYLERHDGAMIADNTVAESDWSGIVVSQADDVFMQGNTVINANTSLMPDQAPIHLINGTCRAVVRGNRFGILPAYAAGNPSSWVIDTSGGTGNDLEPAIRHDGGPPLDGAWTTGSLTWNAAPRPGAPLGWICVGAGTPGTWVPFASLPETR